MILIGRISCQKLYYSEFFPDTTVEIRKVYNIVEALMQLVEVGTFNEYVQLLMFPLLLRHSYSIFRWVLSCAMEA